MLIVRSAVFADCGAIEKLLLQLGYAIDLEEVEKRLQRLAILIMYL